MKIQKAQIIHTAGSTSNLPPCAALRFVPLDGAAGYPRVAHVGAEFLTITGPEWVAADLPDGANVRVEPSHIGDDSNAYFLAGADANYLAVPGVTIPERWIIEYVEDACSALPLSPPVPVWSPVLTLRGTPITAPNQCTPVIDTSAFSALAFRFDTLAGGYSIYLNESGPRVVVQQVATWAVSGGAPQHGWMGMDSAYTSTGLTQLGQYVRGRGGLFLKFPAAIPANTIVVDVYGRR